MTHKSPERIAFFPGSFNPFTVGHKSIVDRALTIFDRVVVGVGYNEAKGTPASAAKASAENINKVYSTDPRVTAIDFDSLAVDAARRVGASAIVKGVRTVVDFEYERSMADVNRSLSGIETVILFASPELASVSSSMVRELQRYGVDVSRFLPEVEQ